jgi:cysteine desulfurase
MPPRSIYLDHNATAPILPEVADAVREAAIRYPGNPASQHEPGRQARRALEAARTRIGELLGAQMHGMDADQVIFTSGGTESNNLALTGLLPRAGSSPTPASRLLISAIEHPSITRTAEHLATLGCQVDRLPITSGGFVRVDDFDEFAHRLTSDVRLVSVMLASNETGVLQPVLQIVMFCRAKGILIHSDATQVIGKLPFSFRASGVDALTFTAHKFHGPLGIGALILRHGVKLDASLHGGFQQAGLRPGTESVTLAIGMQVALEAWHREADQRLWRMRGLRNQLERTILAGDPDAVVIGSESPRLPHTSNIAFVGLDRQALVMALDLAGVACSTGSACASGSSEPSPTLVAMGLPAEQISSSVRFSLGATTTAEDIAEAARRILNVCNQLRRQK